MIRRLALIFCVSALLAVLSPGEAAWPAEGATPRLCTAAVARASAAHSLPGGLLNAISLAETGRWDDSKKASFAWPWTVTSGGGGKFFPSKAAAIAHVEQLKSAGVRNIDVGCMQINLRYHPDAFANLEAAFDPAANAQYAAKFLAGLKRQSQSWQAAIGRYHSATPVLARSYLDKVARLWRGEKQMAAEQQNEKRVLANNARQAAAMAAVGERRAAAERYRADVISRFLNRRAERATGDGKPS